MLWIMRDGMVIQEHCFTNEQCLHEEMEQQITWRIAKEEFKSKLFIFSAGIDNMSITMCQDNNPSGYKTCLANRRWWWWHMTHSPLLNAFKWKHWLLELEALNPHSHLWNAYESTCYWKPWTHTLISGMHMKALVNIVNSVSTLGHYSTPETILGINNVM
jgi:hypothetical protein